MDKTERNDATLISRIAQEQVEALGELYDRYSRLVFSTAFAVVGDKATAGEITLDVFTHVWQQAGSYRPEQARVTTWLLAMARHKAIDVLRQQSGQPALHIVSWDGASPQSAIHGLEKHAEFSLQRERVQVAVAQLPTEQQEALALAYFKGYTHRQIAELLKLPLETVKTRIRLAMQKLRQLLEQESSPLDKSKYSSTAYYKDESD